MNLQQNADGSTDDKLIFCAPDTAKYGRFITSEWYNKGKLTAFKVRINPRRIQTIWSVIPPKERERDFFSNRSNFAPSEGEKDPWIPSTCASSISLFTYFFSFQECPLRFPSRPHSRCPTPLLPNKTQGPLLRKKKPWLSMTNESVLFVNLHASPPSLPPQTKRAIAHTTFFSFPAPWRQRHGRVVWIWIGRSHLGQCVAIHDHEKVQ